MKRSEFKFNTPEEAAAFLEGIEYVNDSAIEAHISEEDETLVLVCDEDAQED